MNKIPADSELEQAVLFALIYKTTLAEAILDSLKIEWLTNGENIAIYKACIECHRLSAQVDPQSVVSILERQDNIQAKNNILIGLQYASSERNIQTHLQMLQEFYIRRKIIAECSGIIEQSYDLESDTYETIDKLARSATAIQDQDNTTHSMTTSQIIEQWDSTPRAQPFTTGNDTLDTKIYSDAGRHPGHLEVTVAHSGHGKTRYAIFKTALLALNGVKTHWFQLEDYGYKTAILFKALLGDQADNIIISDSIFEIERIKREARMSAREYETRNIVIDYVQNLSADRKSRAEDVEYISRQLTRMAIDLSCVVHIMSQITITDPQRKKWNLEPRASDVRWSKQLQQDAHLMSGIFRPFKIDGLADGEDAVDWNGENIHKNSIFLRQLKTRYGEPYGHRYAMIDTNLGLVDKQEWTKSNQINNNAHRQMPKIEDNSPF